MHLESGGGIDPADADAWQTSPEGVRFVTGSSAAWCTAVIAAGEEPAAAAADAAAARTTAAYTGAA